MKRYSMLKMKANHAKILTSIVERCKRCNKIFVQNHKYCPECGKKLEDWKVQLLHKVKE